MYISIAKLIIAWCHFFRQYTDFFSSKLWNVLINICIVQVYYVTCPEVTVNFAVFPATPTGREVTIIEQAQGTCVENAEVVEPPLYLCKGDGKWTLAQGGCACRAGFQPDRDRQRCDVCSPGRYKSGTGDGACEPCPPHSRSTEYGASECRCDVGYYRAADDPRSMACTQPPSGPQNLTVAFADQSTVVLSWLPPERYGGRQDIVYRVQCDLCSGQQVTYTPPGDTFNETRVTISGLAPTTAYR